MSLNRQSYKLPAALGSAVKASLEDWKKNDKVRRLWQGDDPVCSADIVRGALLGALYSLLLIPFGIFGLYLRTGPKGVPILVQPFFALLVAIGGSAYSIILPWVWITVLLIGALVGALSAPVADYIKVRVKE